MVSPELYHRDPKPLVFASRERGQHFEYVPVVSAWPNASPNTFPGGSRRSDTPGWICRVGRRRRRTPGRPKRRWQCSRWNAGRRLHLRVTLIAHGLLPRVMRTDPRPGCVSNAIVSARRDAEEPGPSLTAGRRPRRSRGASGPAKPRSTPLRSWRPRTGSTRSARPVVAA